MKTYFQLDESIVHLNHAAVAPWPIVTLDAITAFADENTRIGSQRYVAWLDTIQQLRQKLALLINAESSDEIALLKNTSEGLSMIAQGIQFKPGENIVIPAEEFPSNKVVWQALGNTGLNGAGQNNTALDTALLNTAVEVRRISIQNVEDPEQALVDAMDDNTRLLSCSSVQYARGLRLDLNRIGNACKQHGTLFCVDAIQSLGAIAFDVEACGADFVVADGHKWMCAPEGTALFYCRKSVQDELKLSQYGWHMLKDPFNFSYSTSGSDPTDFEIVDTALRFESGSPNMLGITALNASLGLLLDIGINNIQTAVINNADYVMTQLKTISDINLLTPDTPGRYAGIITFKRTSVDNVKLYQHLQANNVICAYRGDGIRFSPHFYTEQAAMDKALALVADF